MVKDVTISELVQKTALSENIIRYYVTQELIKPRSLPLRKKRELLFNLNTSEKIITIRALWELGFTMEEIKSILEKIPDLDLLKEKIATLPYPKLTQFLDSHGVNLLERTYLKSILSKMDPVCISSGNNGHLRIGRQARS